MDRLMDQQIEKLQREKEGIETAEEICRFLRRENPTFRLWILPLRRQNMSGEKKEEWL